jgi:hypothetical protein
MWNSRYAAGQGNNPPLFHKIDQWNFGVNDVNDYFEVKRPTPVVVAPGSDMPYCLVHWVDPGAVPTNGDGWPAQAANPGAYVSLLEPNQDSDEITWHPILLSHIPVTLMPGFYVPALPMMAYCGDQWDFDHAWPTTAFIYPEVILMESNFPVEMCPYQVTTETIAAGSARLWYTPWLMSPIASGLVASTTNLVWSKLLGAGGSNNTGTAQTATCTFTMYTKNRTFPDIAANIEYQDVIQTSNLGDGTRANIAAERYGWVKLRLNVNATGATPTGVGYLVF